MSKRKPKKNRQRPTKTGNSEPAKKVTNDKPAKPTRSREPKMVDPDRIAAQRVHQRRKSIVYRSLIGVAVIVVAATVGWVVYRNQQPSGLPDPRDKPAANYIVPAGATKDGITVGKSDASVTVDLFLDYECPHCRDFERKTEGYFNEQLAKGTVKLIYHPISILSGYSVWAAAAAGCAVNEANTTPPNPTGQPPTGSSTVSNGVLTAFTTAIYRRDGELNRGELIEVGQRVGLVSPQFQTCVRRTTYLDWALGLTRFATAHKVNSTPTLVVDGRVVPKSKTMEKYVSDTKRAISTAAST